MLGTVLHAPGDIRCEEVAEPKILRPTDAIIKLSASCICGSDLWPYRRLQPVNEPMHMGHEYCGVVIEVGSAVKTVKLGQFVAGSFCLSDNTCPHCRFGFPSSCEQREFMSHAQAPYALDTPNRTIASHSGRQRRRYRHRKQASIAHLSSSARVSGLCWHRLKAGTMRSSWVR